MVNRHKSIKIVRNKIEYEKWHIYWLNLDSAHKRRETMTSVLKSYKNTRVSAIDNLMAHKMLEKNINPGLLRFFNAKNGDIVWKKHLNYTYSFKELATCLSHLKAIKMARDHNRENAIILEDDMLPIDGFFKKLKQFVQTAPANWDILQLFVNHEKLVGRFTHLVDPWIFWQSRNWGASAYIINRKGMLKLLDKMYIGNKLVFNDPVLVADEVVYAFINSYTLTKPLFQTSNSKSQIQLEDFYRNGYQINTFIEQIMNQPIRTKPEQTNLTLTIITQVINVASFIRDKLHIEKWHSGKINWCQLSPCISIQGIKCIHHISDADDADYILLKHPKTTFLGFSWKTFWQKSLDSTISGVLFALPTRDLKHVTYKDFEMERDDSFFNYFVFTHTEANVGSWAARNRGNFFFVRPYKVDVVLQRFALLNGKFARWYFRQPKNNYPLSEKRYEFEWCGAAAEWSSYKIPCQIVPVGIKQTNIYWKPPHLIEPHSHWLYYSSNFRKKYMRLQKNQILEVPGMHKLKHLSMHISTYPETLIHSNDFILSPHNFFSPIVIEKYKWIVFNIQKVASSSQKRFLRKILGCSDGGMRPQREDDGCFTFLRDYDVYDASSIMTDPTWTRSIFLRDPYERALSGFLFSKKYNYTQKYCQGKIAYNFSYFLTNIVEKCQNGNDPHFNRQYDRVTDKWWPYINFVGTLHNYENDFKNLLRKLNLWETFGKTGWGNGHDSIVKNNEKHKMNTQKKIQEYYTAYTRSFVKKYFAIDIKLLSNIKQNRITNVFEKITDVPENIPHVLIIGTQRAGTTFMKRLLRDQEEISMYPKEARYFDKVAVLESIEKFKKTSLHDYSYKLYSIQRNNKNFVKKNDTFVRNKDIIIEKTPEYLFYPELITNEMPKNTKYIVLLRNPIDRAYSNYLKKRNQRPEYKNTTFEEAIKLNEYENDHNDYSIIQRGKYVIFLERWFKYVSKEKMLIIFYEDLLNFEWSILGHFIGMKKHFKTPNIGRMEIIKKKIKTYHSQISDKTLEILKNIYMPYNRALCRLLQTHYYTCPQWSIL